MGRRVRESPVAQSNEDGLVRDQHLMRLQRGLEEGVGEGGDWPFRAGLVAWRDAKVVLRGQHLTAWASSQEHPAAG